MLTGVYTALGKVHARLVIVSNANYPYVPPRLRFITININENVAAEVLGNRELDQEIAGLLTHSCPTLVMSPWVISHYIFSKRGFPVIPSLLVESCTILIDEAMYIAFVLQMM